ncbi:VOC family protein [Mucilaginibacter mali]|uniref:VOC family protein n=1 Tax=Mucilaginibacter mali TaxID=2740462 RepID=A0A7D4TYC9_9SPHI|nr:VOC family protein [Mucilaginibacter mali]QKJ31257.1 VOC family protein [Mucilaginibacter mali]
MATQIFVNLPVKDLSKTIAFFEGLGYSFNPQFTNELAGCMVVSDTIYFMMVTEGFFQTFTNKPISDATKATEVLNCVSVESREKADELYDKAIAGGGQPSKEPTDYGWMYGRSFQDLDGHQWEVMYLDPAGPPAEH